MWPISTALADYEGACAVGFGAGFAFVDAADVGQEGPGEVAAGNDVALVEVEPVGAADHVFAAFEGPVDDDGKAVAERGGFGLEANGAEIAGGRVQELLEFLGLHGAEFGCADGAEKLGFVDLVIAAEEGGNSMPCVRRAFLAAFEGHVGDALDVGGGERF